MAFKDYVIEKSVISCDTVIEVEEFIQHLREWYGQHKYHINEKLYLGLPKKTDIKWKCHKGFDDYHKMVIKMKISVDPTEESKKITKGTLKIAFEGEVERDPENRWAGKFNFMWRAFFDKYIATEKEKEVRKELKKDLISLKQEIKKYLNI